MSKQFDVIVIGGGTALGLDGRCLRQAAALGPIGRSAPVTDEGIVPDPREIPVVAPAIPQRFEPQADALAAGTHIADAPKREE